MITGYRYHRRCPCGATCHDDCACEPCVSCGRRTDPGAPCCAYCGYEPQPCPECGEDGEHECLEVA